MKRFFLICLFSMLVSCFGAAAQGIIVTGRLTSSVDGSPMPGARIFVFKTVAEGREFYEMAKRDMDATGIFDPAAYNLLVRQFASSEDGSYLLTDVIEKGSIVYIADPFMPVFEKVNGRETINVVIEATHVLDESLTTAKREKKTRRGTRPTSVGKRMGMTRFYYLKKDAMGDVEGVGKSNARLVAQAYIVNSDGTDTIHYFEPRVYTGSQFKKTQKHWSDDYLYALADSIPRELTEDTDSIHIPVLYEFDDPTVLYYCNANIWIEDYLQTYYRDTVSLFNTGRVSRPFQFLEYSFDQCNIDAESKWYKKLPKKEKVATPKNMKLKFLPSKADLDRTDAATMAALDSLKDELDVICKDSYSQLKELHFKGYSSPDGSYAKNVPLSKDRTRNVFNEIYYGLPGWAREKVYHTDSGFVATWENVAALMEKDSLVTEAAEIREIVAQHPDNMDAQFAKMKNLSFYKTTMAPYREELRSVQCEYITEVFRALEPHEIYKKYMEDPDLRNGRKFMTLNEYWHLFNLVEDEAELERLYIRAKRHAWNMERKEWALPNNLLAIRYLKRKQVDTTLLHPFIDESYGPNQEVIVDMNGTKALVNDDAIVANQVQMLMLAGKYDRAEELSSIIENEHPMLRAIVRCLGGFIDYDDPAELPTIDLIRHSSPRNEVIVNLYMAVEMDRTELFDSTTVAALNKMNQDDPVTSYIRAQRLCMKYLGDPVEMKSQTYDRDKEDPLMRYPKDEVIPAATPADIESQKKELEIIKEAMELEAMYGEVSDFTKNELKSAEDKLALMMTGEEKVNPVDMTVYDAVYHYLRECFRKDRKYVKTAQADYDINEEILKEVVADIDKSDAEVYRLKTEMPAEETFE